MPYRRHEKLNKRRALIRVNTVLYIITRGSKIVSGAIARRAATSVSVRRGTKNSICDIIVHTNRCLTMSQRNIIHESEPEMAALGVITVLLRILAICDIIFGELIFATKLQLFESWVTLSSG